MGIYGFGSIGRIIAKKAIERGWEVVGAVDIREDLVGRDIGEIIGIGEYGVKVSRDPDSLATADVVVHATSSFFDKVYDQLISIVRLGVDIVSTCETLAYPFYRYPVLSRMLNEEALKYGVTVIGTGINPGFLLDTLLIVLSTPFTVVKRIRAVRSVDAGKRRESFKKKIGIGLDPSRVIEMLEKREITGHVGYAESVYLVADAAGIELEKVVEGQEPVVASEDIVYGGTLVPKGKTLGLKGYGAGFVGGREIIRIEFTAYLGASDYEEITIEGDEYSTKWTSTGTPGDTGTAAVVLNIAGIINDLPAGLLTMSDILPFKPFIKL